jgi:hypothetical protein
VVDELLLFGSFKSLGKGSLMYEFLELSGFHETLYRIELYIRGILRWAIWQRSKKPVSLGTAASLGNAVAWLLLACYDL